MATVTITIATPAVVTDTAHGHASGDFAAYTTTGALPTGLVYGTAYYVSVIDANNYNLAATRANAIAGTSLIATSGTQSGVHTASNLDGVSPAALTQVLAGGKIQISNVPLAKTVNISGMAADSRVRVSKAADNAELFIGYESAGKATFSTKYAGDVYVEVRKASSSPKYKPYKSPAVIGDNGLDFLVSQELDTVA